MQAPGWTVAILPLALSGLAVVLELNPPLKMSREDHIFPFCPWTLLTKTLNIRRKKKNEPFMEPP